MSDMSARLLALRSQLPSLQSTLETFNASPSKFHIVRTINPSPTQPRTLYILDSSFNPPSRAHLSLATSALTNQKPGEEKPTRLLLLFSTHNADKAPSPASFVQRIALMTVFAEDVLRSLQSSSDASDDTNNVSIDIGLTKEPYYTDKSVAIAAEAPEVYASKPIHVHLVGYDTLIRFCNPKYYADYKPPLSALKPFFDAGHKLRVTQRPYDANDASSKEFGTVEDQEKYLQNIKEGGLEKDGFEASWRGNIDMVEGTGMGISSTRVRKEAKDGNWEEVGRLCTEGVTAWMREEGLYKEDASGKKMMG
ncbi:Nucleotidylyl transferase [Karstenula rhodostoma CBS 690.94]|uniref:Nucleotidylyl transferase n=1 Tax=Karstenula rhodostoma CBS 690.94 TaxID=1392251 RepID=A0A9P4PCQ0_9PLEO|nr:Nucleotidylyl transferase [Karstenula rhodostoma CBS 690.94]